MGISHLPQRIVDVLSPDDRKEYARHVGNPNASLTSAELRELEQKRFSAAEKKLQRAIGQYLMLKGSSLPAAMFSSVEDARDYLRLIDAEKEADR